MTVRATAVDHHLGKKLKTARIVKNMSQDALAKMVNITFQQIQKYEKGLNRMSAARLYQFGHILGVEFNFFFDGIDRILQNEENENPDNLRSNINNNNKPSEINWDSKETISLLHTYYSIKDEQTRNKIFELIKAIESQQKDNSMSASELPTYIFNMITNDDNLNS